MIPPVATTIVSIKKSITKLNEDSFIEKLQLFLSEVESSKDEREEFIKLLEKDLDEFFIRLWKVLDRFEDKEKASIVGRLFKGLLKGKINTEEFKKLCTTIDNTYIGTLKKLVNFGDPIFQKFSEYRPQQISEFVTQTDETTIEQKQLAAVGLLYEKISIEASQGEYGINDVKQKTEFVLTQLGMHLLHLGLVRNN